MPQSPSSLAETLDALSRVPGLSVRNIADLQSAIRCLCRVLGADPATVVASDLGTLQAKLAAASPERHGLSPARWAVIRSQTVRALALTGAAEYSATIWMRAARQSG